MQCAKAELKQIGTAMTEKQWQDVDARSRGIVSCLLCDLDASRIGESSGCCCWDLSCLLKGKPTSVEIKERSIPHNRFGDIMVEDIKVQATLDKQEF